MILKKRENGPNVIHNIQPACKCKLKKCNLKISAVERKRIRFWKQDNYGRKLWLSNHVNIIKPKRRYTKESEESEDTRRRARKAKIHEGE